MLLLRHYIQLIEIARTKVKHVEFLESAKFLIKGYYVASRKLQAQNNTQFPLSAFRTM